MAGTFHCRDASNRSTGSRYRPGVRRRLVTACVLGLLTTLAVALVLGATSAYGSRNTRFGARLRDPSAGEGVGELRARVFGRRGRVVIETAARRRYAEVGTGPTPETIVPAWARHVALPWLDSGAAWPAEDAADARAIRATGWPCATLFHRYAWREDRTLPFQGEYVTPGGIRLEASRGTPGAWPITYPRALPLLPIWRGLLADSLLFGVAWLLVLNIAPALRRKLTSKTGHCGACGYNLQGLSRGSACPECGTPPHHPHEGQAVTRRDPRSSAFYRTPDM